MFTNHHILYRTDPNGKNTKYNLIYIKFGIYEICSMKTSYIHIKTRCRHPSVLHGVYISNLDPYGSKIINMSSKCVNIPI